MINTGIDAKELLLNERHSFIYFIIYFRHVSNICLDRKSQPLTSSSNYNTSLLKTSHVDSPLSSCSTQVQPPLGSPTVDLSSSNTFSHSSSTSPLTSLESHKSSSTDLKIQMSTLELLN